MDLRDISILFVDGNIDIRQSFDFFMRDNIKNLYFAKDGIEGLEFFYTYKPDIIIADADIPILNGFEMSKIIKKGNFNTPIMLISDYKDTIIMEKAIDIKIDAFINKPVVDTSLIIQKLETFAKKTINNKNTKQFLKTGTIDKLTGLNNRYKINEVLSNEKNRNSRFGTFFSIILISIDNFTKINNTSGDLRRNQFLIEFANIILSGLRVEDVAGRWGKEEFIIILPETDKFNASILAEYLKKKIKLYSFCESTKQSINFGIVQCKSDDNIKNIIKKADKALCETKKLEKSTVCIS